METKVLIPTNLRSHAAGADELTVSGNTVRELIDNLEQQAPGIKAKLLDDKGIQRFVNIYLGEEDVRFLEGLDTELTGKDDLSIIPAIAGGRG